MCEKFGIDYKTRFLVLYFDAQMDIHEISKIISRPVRTMRHWLTVIKKGEDIRIVKKGRGPKRSITEETENKIIQMVNEDTEGTSLRKIAARTGLAHSTISGILAKKGFKYKTFDQSIVFEEDERMIRVDFCKRMLADEGNLIYKTFYSDEMGIELSSARKTKGWHNPSEKIKRKLATENTKLSCWGAISAKGATSLEIYKKGMNGDLFRQVIENHKEEMENLYPEGEFYFIQDNHPTHRMNEDWMIQEQKLEIIKLPRRSPDLNIIENLWITLKDRVKRDAPMNEKELRVSLLNNWMSLTKPERMQPFFEGLQRRYKECVALDGHKLPG